MTNEQFEKLDKENYGERLHQATEKFAKHIKVFSKIVEYLDDVFSKAIESVELDEDSSEVSEDSMDGIADKISKLQDLTNAVLSSDEMDGEMDGIADNISKLRYLALHISKCSKNIAVSSSSAEEVMSGIEEMEYLLKKNEEMIENVLKLNNLSLEKLGFDSRYLSTPQYNSQPQYGEASKNSGCLGVIAVMIIILCILV